MQQLWNDLQYIDTQIHNLKSDIKYVMVLIARMESEIDFAKKEMESCVH
jgi:prefoldin subunit 5